MMLCTLHNPGYQTRSLFFSDRENDTARAQGALAGGFWRSRRQRRKNM